MSTTEPSLEIAFPEFAHGSIWLVGADGGDLHRLSSLATQALGTADAVIHEPGVPQTILDLVTPPRYQEAASPRQAVERSIKLAQDGWRVVHLVNGKAIDRAIECGISFAEHDIPFRIAPTGDKPVIGEAPIGLLLVRQTRSVGRSETGTLVVLAAKTSSEVPADSARRQAPLSFSMPGLAG